MSKLKEPKSKKSRGKKALRVIIVILVILALIVGAFLLVGFVGNKANTERAQSLPKVVQDDPLSAPFIDEETGYYTFTCERTFKVLQLTDVHIGGGPLSIRKDSLAIDAVYKMIEMVKPDLVIITGDMAFPVPYASGSFNNLNPAKIFAEMMESIGVYWTIGFGNHDTEAYAFYNRDQIGAFYSEVASKAGSHCLFYERPEDKSLSGSGNFFINVQNTSGQITQSFIVFDSHSYKKGFFQDYDNIHQDQIDWYASEIERLNTINHSRGATGMFKSMAFFHIPMTEMKAAYDEWVDNGKEDTANVKYLYGNDGEANSNLPGSSKVVFCGTGEDELFETMLELGSTQSVYFGHDHLNNFSLLYNGGSGSKYIRLTYGLSIDYLAYFGIAKKTAQRGGTVIEVEPDGTFVSYAKRMIDGKEYRTAGDFEAING